jgi:hypothetical protein
MMTNRGVRKRFVVDLYKETLDKESANFPKEFESVSDETHKVIGLDDSQTKKVKAFEAEIKTYKEKSKSFADEIFSSLFGSKSLDYSLPNIKELESSRPRVKTPDEEEEIFYTPSEDEILPDDEVEDIVDHGPVKTRMDILDQRDSRNSRHSQRNENHNHHPRQNSNRSQFQNSHGPKHDGPRPDGRRPDSMRERPQRDEDRSSRGPRPQAPRRNEGRQQRPGGRNRPPN